VSITVEGVLTFTAPNLRCATGVVRLDASYPTGGYPVTHLQLSDGYVREKRLLLIEPHLDYTWQYHDDTQTLEVRTAGAEVVGGTDLSTVHANYFLLGRDPTAI
jgi:hypothetical protein